MSDARCVGFLPVRPATQRPTRRTPTTELTPPSARFSQVYLLRSSSSQSFVCTVFSFDNIQHPGEGEVKGAEENSGGAAGAGLGWSGPAAAITSGWRRRRPELLWLEGLNAKSPLAGGGTRSGGSLSSCEGREGRHAPWGMPTATLVAAGTVEPVATARVHPTGRSDRHRTAGEIASNWRRRRAEHLWPEELRPSSPLAGGGTRSGGGLSSCEGREGRHAPRGMPAATLVAAGTVEPVATARVHPTGRSGRHRAVGGNGLYLEASAARTPLAGRVEPKFASGWR
jgi:hypothetical protein